MRQQKVGVGVDVDFGTMTSFLVFRLEQIQTYACLAVAESLCVFVFFLVTGTFDVYWQRPIIFWQVEISLSICALFVSFVGHR